jgi:hypothetical protein
LTEKPRMSQLPVRLPASHHEALRRVAEREGVSMSNYVQILVAQDRLVRRELQTMAGGDTDETPVLPSD